MFGLEAIIFVGWIFFFFCEPKTAVAQTAILFRKDFLTHPLLSTQLLILRCDAIDPDPLVILHSDDFGCSIYFVTLLVASGSTNTKIWFVLHKLCKWCWCWMLLSASFHYIDGFYCCSRLSCSSSSSFRWDSQHSHNIPTSIEVGVVCEKA